MKICSNSVFFLDFMDKPMAKKTRLFYSAVVYIAIVSLNVSFVLKSKVVDRALLGVMVKRPFAPQY